MTPIARLSEARMMSRITHVGVLLIACQTGSLVVVVMALVFSPESPLGSFLSTPKGLVLVAMTLSGSFSILAPILAMLGVPVARRTWTKRLSTGAR